MVRTVVTEGAGDLAIPMGSLITVATIAAIAGVVAALMPASRAAPIDILTAVAGG